MGAFAFTAIVCGAWFSGLPAGWHQSSPTATPLVHRTTDTNTSSWAANFRPSPRYGIGKGFPRDGIYVWIGLSRPEAHVDGERLRFPLRLRDASILTLEGTSNLPEYRFDGRYRQQQYRVLAGVDFGRPRPTRGMLREADRVLRRLVLPGWLPRPARCRG